MIGHGASKAIPHSSRFILQIGRHQAIKPSSRILLRPFSPGFTSARDYKASFTNLQAVGTSRYFSASVGTNKNDNLTSFLSTLSPRLEAQLEEKIMDGLRTVVDPVLQVNIRKLGWISSIQFPNARTTSSTTEDPALAIFLSIPPLHPYKQEIEEKVHLCVQEVIISALKESSNFEDNLDLKEVSVNVKFLEGSKPTPLGVETDDDELLKKLGPGLKNVGHFLAVYSCKVSKFLIK